LIRPERQEFPPLHKVPASPYSQRRPEGQHLRIIAFVRNDRLDAFAPEVECRALFEIVSVTVVDGGNAGLDGFRIFCCASSSLGLKPVDVDARFTEPPVE
jgi:hypothetical protein